MAFLSTVVILLAVADVKPTTIPLDQVWALDMPGTHSLADSLGDKSNQRETSSERSGLELLKRTLATRKSTESAMSGFAINAESLPRALTWAHMSIRRGEPFNDNLLDTAKPAYLVFFSYESAYRVVIEQIVQRGQEFEIQYRFVPTYSVESTIQFALIRVGMLSPGEYRVVLHKLPLEQKFLAAGFKDVNDDQVRQLVCLPFEFSIRVPSPIAEETNSEATKIPLSKIWASDMPGTRPLIVRLKDGKHTTEEGPLISDILKALGSITRDDITKPHPGFVVRGAGLEALENAREVLCGGENRNSVLPPSRELSLVFYTFRSLRYIHIHDATISGNKIRVRFKFVPHQSSNVTHHFALVPLGHLEQGDYEVSMERLPMEEKYVQDGWRPQPTKSDKLVCDSFNFTVGEKPKS